jgi:tungstate transport system ATP-binding protein
MDKTAPHGTELRPLLQVEALYYEKSGQRLLDGVTFALDARARTIVLGANGAGKSVLLRLLHGLLLPSSGRISWTADSGGDLRQAMLFQRPVLLRRSALANIGYALKLAGISGDERKRRALDALQQAGLASLARRPARVLSGGEQQRLALARARALDPDVLLLDEPTANLDPAATREVEAAVRSLHAAGKKIIMTTHNLGQARRLADDVVFIHAGRVTESTPAAEFFAQPRSREAAEFLREELA